MTKIRAPAVDTITPSRRGCKSGFGSGGAAAALAVAAAPLCHHSGQWKNSYGGDRPMFQLEPEAAPGGVPARSHVLGRASRALNASFLIDLCTIAGLLSAASADSCGRGIARLTSPIQSWPPLSTSGREGSEHSDGQQQRQRRLQRDLLRKSWTKLNIAAPT